MSKINDQQKDEKVLNQTELGEVDGGEKEAYEAPEVTKVEFDDTKRDLESHCYSIEAFIMGADPNCRD